MKHYIIYGNYLSIGAGIVNSNYPRILDIIEAESYEAAFQTFINQHCQDVRQAQRFYDDIMIAELPKEACQYKLSDYFGQLAKFPNPELFADEEYYW